MKKFLLLFAFLAIGFNPGFCAENMLNSVELSQSEDGYELKLNTQEPVAFKKKVESNDSVYFDLKNVMAPEKIDTVYNNVSDIDGVVIQQMGKNQIRIYINGLDASNTKLVTQTGVTGTKTEPKEIIINRPMSEYAPITGEEKYFERSDWENNGFNIKYLAGSILGKLKKSKIDFTLMVSIMLVVASLIGLKRAFSKVKIEEPIIGINKKAFEDLMEGTDAAPGSQDALLEKLSAQNNKKTRQTPPQNIPPRNIPQGPQRAPINNYAINSYQKNQNLNPYAEPGPVRQDKSFAYPNRGATISQPQRRIIEPAPAIPAAKKAFSTDVESAVANPIKKQAAGAAQGKNIENIQFLESITKIYEQSGRKDLANGLRANINKIRANV